MTVKVTKPIDIRAEQKGRLVPLDALRGVLMLLMAVDHASLLVRGVHSYEVWNEPLPNYVETASFWTRFVTHFCAPGFFFLMGAGLVLRVGRADATATPVILRAGYASPKDLARRRLFERVLLLILLEQLFVDPILHGRIIWTEFGVLSALGVVLILSALMRRLGARALLGLGLGTELLCQIPPRLWPEAGTAVPLWVRLLFLPGATGEWFILYPILPWLGIALLGMAFGQLAARDEGRAYGLAARAGLTALVAFVLLRLTGASGGWMEWLSVVKYPPSLEFILLTLGGGLLLLWALAHASERYLRPLVTYGRCALFFYLVHWRILAILARFFPSGHLGWMCAAWSVAMAAMYPLCALWGSFRASRPPNSPWRLL